MDRTASKYPYHHESSAEVAAAPQALFDFIDDPCKLSSHMTQKSWMMAGSTMSVSTDAAGGRQVGSLISLDASMMGVRLTVRERVIERSPPSRKTWETIGEPRLIVMGAYRMGFTVAPLEAGRARLTIFIDYGLPARGLQRFFGRWLAPVYARWCASRMLQDAQGAFRGR